MAAGFLNGMRAQGTPLESARVVLFGAGSSAIGVGETIAATMAADTGVSLDAAKAKIYVMDSKGLITTTRGDWATVPTHKRSLARTDGSPNLTSLVDIITHVKPHALIGLSGVGGAFKEDAVSALAAVTARPLIMPCSNPTDNAECTPAQAYEWTNGAAMVATGSPFDPVTLPDGSVRESGQANNFFTFPGELRAARLHAKQREGERGERGGDAGSWRKRSQLHFYFCPTGIGLGAVLVKSTAVTDGMLLAAAHALAATVPDASVAAGTLYPPLEDMRRTTLAVATAVATAAYSDRVATVPRPTELTRYIADRMYWPGGEVPADWGATVDDVTM